MDGPRIESRWGQDVSHTSPPTLAPNQPPVQWISGVFPRGIAAGRKVYYPPPSIADVKENVQLHLYSPSGPLWPVLGWTVTLTCRVHELFVTRVFGMQVEKQQSRMFLGCFLIVAKRAMSVLHSVGLSICLFIYLHVSVKSAPTGRTSMKLQV
jgi:hypothetical protein